ncbi:carboxypeptidase regulatory-like domain-containing protein [Azoarcus indigens]|uniref:Nickel transport protein n=1 Tax=Azoarcus indigens TaxID=29545 RepID=A0A4R6DV00_9RHOO|nr:carboxypeptidase-like regulatory domain-containing protein [Azoarcus indigens]NMG65080.1 carboxypeptidase regulatory-like domain-containing protein [Azoarcus indigens]TDN48973.1 nickel transport protein [Azoarcus indigens]
MTQLPSALRPLATAAALLLATAAQAHGLAVVAQHEADAVTGLARYTDQTPAAGIYVAVTPENSDTPLAEGTTGADGRFRLPVPPGGPYWAVVEGEEGHRAETLAVQLPAAAGGNGEATAEALRLVREDIARLEQQIRLRDIIGGIGYIVGIAGIAAWFAARRRG